jgi:hypothetical protein
MLRHVAVTFAKVPRGTFVHRPTATNVTLALVLLRLRGVRRIWWLRFATWHFGQT